MHKVLLGLKESKARKARKALPEHREVQGLKVFRVR